MSTLWRGAGASMLGSPLLDQRSLRSALPWRARTTKMATTKMASGMPTCG